MPEGLCVSKFIIMHCSYIPFRHLSLSQLVVACLVTIGGLSERVKMLKKLVDLANQLQSGSYGNLFSFLAIMKGLASEQVQHR